MRSRLQQEADRELRPRRCLYIADISIVIQRSQALHLAVDDISAKVREAATSDCECSLGAFLSSVDGLPTGHTADFNQYQVDEAVVLWQQLRLQ